MEAIRGALLMASWKRLKSQSLESLRRSSEYILGVLKREISSIGIPLYLIE
jgi:hypothetical protein